MLTDEVQLCSDCFVQMMHHRLSSPYLPDTDHSDYLVEQFQDIQDVCSTSMPALTTRAPPSYPPVPTASAMSNYSTGHFSNFSMNNSTNQSQCDGQLIHEGMRRRSISFSKHGQHHPFRYVKHKGTRDVGSLAIATNCSLCDELSEKYGVTTGDLQEASGNDDCSHTDDLCLPAPCTVKKVPDGTSW